MLECKSGRKNIKRAHHIKGVSKSLQERVKTFLLGAVYCWCKNKKAKPFSAADLIGGHSEDWAGTPLAEITQAYLRGKNAPKAAEMLAGVAVGWLLRDALEESNVLYERTAQKYVAHYSRGGFVKSIAAIALLMFSFSAYANTWVDEEQGITWNYVVIDGEASIEGGREIPAIQADKEGNVKIPSTLGGYPVTRIGDYAFYKCGGLTSVSIPSGVTYVGKYAFDYCRGLSSVTIPGSVTSIEDFAFAYCDGLKSVTIPEGVTSIGSCAFSSCSELSSVTIPSSVAYIDESPFSRTKLIEDHPDGLVIVDGCLIGYKGTCTSTVVIPDNVRIIAGDVFSFCAELKSVVIPSSVTSIGSYAFGFSGLVSVTIPPSVRTIPLLAFYYCEDLTAVTISEGVTRIGESAFAYCSKLSSLTIPDGVTSIERCAFQGCSELKTVTLPSSVMHVEEDAFDDTKLMNSHPAGLVIIGDCLIKYKGTCSGAVEIPDGVRVIGDSAFIRCSGLTAVAMPSSVTSIGACAFSGCSKLASVTMPEGVTSIGACAFGGCSKLDSVTIPTGVTVIEEGTFVSSGLKSVTIPSGVVSINDDAFYECVGLMAVTIPSSVTEIGYWAFYSCDSLQVVFVADEPQECVKQCFGDEMWYQKIGTPIDYEWECSYEDGKATIIGIRPVFGDVVIPSTIDGCPVVGIGYDAFNACVGLMSVTISEGVTSIGGNAFYNCSELKSVVIPSSVTSIGSKAFTGCSGLTSVTIPASVVKVSSTFPSAYTKIRDAVLCEGTTRVEDSLFYGCSGLTSIVIPSGVTDIGESAFYGCRKLESVILPDEVTRIGESAFYGCWGLMSLTIPKGVRSIGASAFRDCSALTTVTIPEGISSIEVATFYECNGLKAVTIPSSVTSIKASAFYGCGLNSVTIPANVTSIGDFAFCLCKELTAVTIPASVTSIGRQAFANCSQLNIVYIRKGEEERVAGLYEWSSKVKFVEIDFPVIAGDEDAIVTGDPVNGFVIKPSEGKTAVEVTIPQGVDAAKVTVEVSPKVASVKPNGAKVKIVSGGADITEFLNVPAVDGNGVVDLTKATVKEEIVKEAMDVEKGAKIELNAADPLLTTPNTRIGLFYTFSEGMTLGGMERSASKTGDGKPWSPEITVKGGNAAFYSIGVGKGE